MFAQQNKLKNLFPEYGWELVENQTPDDNWIIEVWLIKSLWSPANCFVFISFNVDPQWEDRKNKSKGFWDISLTLSQPDYWNTDRFDIDIQDDKVFNFFLKTHFEKSIPEVFDSLNNLRLRFKNLK